MLFFNQIDNKSCQITAIQTALSHYNLFLSVKEIKSCLPKHSFGNLITEIGIYFEHIGIKTTIVSNNAKVRSTNKLFYQSLEEYKKVGKYYDRKVKLEDFKNVPVIVNVDWYKVKKQSSDRGAHYIVVINENSGLYLYDSSNYDKPERTSLEELLKMSQSVNRLGDDGLYLICNSSNK